MNFLITLPDETAEKKIEILKEKSGFYKELSSKVKVFVRSQSGISYLFLSAWIKAISICCLKRVGPMSLAVIVESKMVVAEFLLLRIIRNYVWRQSGVLIGGHCSYNGLWLHLQKEEEGWGENKRGRKI